MAEKFTIRSIDGARVVSLVRPIEAPGKQITSIVLRKPRYKEVMKYGDPASLIVFSGSVLPHEDMGIVETYVGILAGDQEGSVVDPIWLEQCDYRDGLALKDAVISFFKQETAVIAQPSSQLGDAQSENSSLDKASA